MSSSYKESFELEPKRLGPGQKKTVVSLETKRLFQQEELCLVLEAEF